MGFGTSNRASGTLAGVIACLAITLSCGTATSKPDRGSPSGEAGMWMFRPTGEGGQVDANLKRGIVPKLGREVRVEVLVVPLIDDEPIGIPLNGDFQLPLQSVSPRGRLSDEFRQD